MSPLERLKNRWIYGLTAGASASIFFPMITSFSGIGEPIEFGNNPFLILMFLCAIPMIWGFILFPGRSRSSEDMQLCGVIVVFLSALSLCMIWAGFSVIEDFNPTELSGSTLILTSLYEIILGLFKFTFFLMAGTIFTLGLPWWMAIAISALFVSKDEGRADIEAALDTFVAKQSQSNKEQ